MKNSVEVLVTVIRDSKTGKDVYVCMFENGSYDHPQQTDQITWAKYEKLIKKNFPHYNLVEEFKTEEQMKTKEKTPVMMTPPVEPARQAEHPLKEEMAKAFDVDDAADTIPVKEEITELIEEDIVNIGRFSLNFSTGFVTEPGVPPVEMLGATREYFINFYQDIVDNPDRYTNVNKLNQDPVMETKSQQAPEVEATTVEQPVKKTVLQKTGNIAKHGVKLTVQSATVPTHTGLVIAADLLMIAALGVRNVEAFVIDKLNITTDDITRQDIQRSIDQRAKTIESVIFSPITYPIMQASVIKEKLRERREQRESQAQASVQTA